ncbi:AraC family transcriptional regulator [Galbibacter sp. EGI 63066]|uniref:helix-turn-helix transcriptional regulator n=1 Tax=Galbibacter sp. EGI 63066 TaxID=2993559 RepID=UPI00224877F6|nr:AraC family transcriptional regulator [Galbibacter sp. EGI 63066]MCX2680639.1 AraC family transcriptional regulator [Galbibacter sp. EGI 63066]
MDAETKERLNKVYQLLVEMSKGNFSYRIARSDQRDELEALIALTNMTAEEIEDSFLHQGYVSMHDSYITVTQTLLLLNDKGVISKATPNSHQNLHYQKNELPGLSLKYLLTKSSYNTWTTAFKKALKETSPEKNIKLTFKTKKGLLLPVCCTVASFQQAINPDRTFLVTFPTIMRNNAIMEHRLRKKVDKHLSRISKTLDNTDYKPILSYEDIQKIRSIGEHIQNNPEDQISSLNGLALEFGTNEFKLKKGFRDLYGMTVFQFQKNERLRKAHILVQSTDKPFKEITKLTGFVSPAHFSTVFKKRYGYSPRSLRKLP